MANTRIAKHGSPYPQVSSNTGQGIYNSPHWAVSGGKDSVIQASPSSVGKQLTLEHYIKKALIDASKYRYFSQLGDTVNLPKHSGRSLTKFHYIPILDDRNKNQQGIDAQGINSTYAGSGDGAGKNPFGNLWGGSSDISAISTAEPFLSEIGGRVNRVGQTRLVLKADTHEVGFFQEFTEDSLNMDSDAELLSHLSRESIVAAQQISEQLLAKDLVNGAGHVRFAGAATSVKTLTAESGAVTCTVDYHDIQRLAHALDVSEAPKGLKASKGTSTVDSIIIPAARALYIHPDLEIQIRNMIGADGHTPAFIPVEKYAASGTAMLHGEIGAIGQFRVIPTKLLPYYKAGGATCTTASSTAYSVNKGFAGNLQNNTTTTTDYYDAYPMLAVASESFSTIVTGWGISANKSSNFHMKTTLPGEQSQADPFGKTGMMAINFNVGNLIYRPEYIACLWTLAEK